MCGCSKRLADGVPSAGAGKWLRHAGRGQGALARRASALAVGLWHPAMKRRARWVAFYDGG